jgi:glycine/D-amino acid oxidase-like deaminating enzyme
VSVPHWLSKAAEQAVPEHDGPLPDACDLVIIGGGVIGVATAIYARRAGLSVVLLDKGRVGAEQSTRNWGWIRTQGRDPAEIPISLESRGLWADLNRDCQGRLGIATVGVTYLARDTRTLLGYGDWLESARGHGLDSRILTRAELRALMPNADDRWAGALHTASDMRGEPWAAVPDLARLAAREGVVVRENCAVRGLDMAAGRVAGVVTERGPVRAAQVVLAGGAWSALFLARHGVRIPQLSVRATVVATDAVPDVQAGAATDADFAWRRRDDGGYTLAPSAYSELFIGPDAVRNAPIYLKLLAKGGFQVVPRLAAPRGFPDAWTTPRRWRDDETSPFERMRILDPAPPAAKAAELPRQFAAAFPGTAPPRVARAWAGMIDVLPDVVPIVDRCAALPGLTVATGMCGHGFGIGPAFGRIVADMVQGRALGHDMTRFRFGRFHDGQPLTPGPNL